MIVKTEHIPKPEDYVLTTSSGSGTTTWTYPPPSGDLISPGILDSGLRFNEGKLRYDLINPYATEQLAKVFTLGAQKYAPRNWEKGMSWMSVIASLKRHLAAIERGEDYDLETGLLHSAHVEWNAHALTAYYKIAQNFDDRPHTYLKPKRIGLDIDDVLADWIGTFCRLSGFEIPKNWYFGFPEKIKQLIDEGLNYSEVMENLPVKTSPNSIPFEPVCYITNRGHTDVSVAEKWIAKNGFSQVPVIQTTDKIKACKDMNVEIFVDDKYDTFVALNNAGIKCYLFDAPWNQRYNVGYHRIKSLKELV